MNTKELERNIRTIIKTGTGYGAEFLPILQSTKKILKKINQGRTTAENYFQLGTLLLDLEDNQLALDAFQTGYTLNNNHVYCGTYYALLLEQFDRTTDALRIYLQLNKTNPENIEIAERILGIYEEKADQKAVLTLCQYFLSRGLIYPVIHQYLAKAYHDLSDNASAVRHMEICLSLLDADEGSKHINLLVSYYYINENFKKILDIKDKILSLPNTTLASKIICANSLAVVGKLIQARGLFYSLYIEQKTKKNKFSVLVDIALFHQNHEYDSKKACFINQYILKRDPNNVHALTNLSLHESDEFAFSAYKKLYEEEPDDVQYRYNYGHCLLHAQGDFEKGFELFESRVPLRSKFLSKVLSYPETLDNKKIFIWAEQGLGDHITNAWYFQFLARLNTISKIQIDKRLMPLMNRSFPSLEFTGKSHKEVIITENVEKNYDHEMIHLSLGKYFIDNIRDSQKAYETGMIKPPYLVADNERIAYWQQRLRSITEKKVVGICWRSGKQDSLRNRHFMSVDEMIKIFHDIDCYVVNLQYSYSTRELDILSQSLGERFIHFPEIDLKDNMDDLAALLKSLDLVFTTPTAVHDLSGAIGVNTLCFVHFGANEYYSRFGKSYHFAYPMVEYIGQKNTTIENSNSYFKEKIIKELLFKNT